MRKAIGLFIVLITISFTASARIKIPFGERQELNLVYNLPDIAEYALEDGKTFLDLACLHTEYNVAFLPLWITKEPQLVLYNAADGSYMELTDEQLNKILATNNLKKGALTKLGFFTRYGGKVIGLGIIALMIFGMIPSKKKKVVPQEV